MAFGLYEDGHAVPMGTAAARGNRWKRATCPSSSPTGATATSPSASGPRPSRCGAPSYETGLESTLAWAVFDITNRGKEPREVTFFAAESGDNKTSQAEPQLSATAW